MKRFATGWMLLAVMLLVVGLAGCEGDEGPAGPAGTASCMNCHTDQFDDELATFLKPYQTQFSFSQHGTGDTYERNSVPCSRCHTSEGFQHYVNTGEVISVPGSSQIHCFTCHAPHTNENFTVRVMNAVALDVGGTYDKLESNTCATCHQAREASPAIADGLKGLSRRWGPHHGPQGNILSGNGAYEFSGTSYSSTHNHNNISNGCVNCHMADPLGPLVGGHSFWLREEGDDAININGCGCHTSGGSPDFTDEEGGYEYLEEWRTEFNSKLEALAADMETLGWINPSAGNGYVNTVYPASSDTIIWQADQLGAIWNWEMLHEDRTGGMHNPTYASDVLEATQNYVTSQMAASQSLADLRSMKSK